MNMFTQFFSAHRKGFSRRELGGKDHSVDFSIVLKISIIPRSCNTYPEPQIIKIISPSILSFLKKFKASHVTPRNNVISPHHPSLCIPKTANFMSSQEEWKQFKECSSCWSKEPGLCPKCGPEWWQLYQSLPQTRSLGLLQSCTQVTRPSPNLVCTPMTEVWRNNVYNTHP